MNFSRVINHGVPQDLMKEAMKVYEGFFYLPMDEKEKYAKEPLYTYSTKHNDSEEHRYWKEVLEHNCNVDGQDQNTWPTNPPNYREVIGQYSCGLRKLSKIILDLISEALGLEAGYFGKEHGQRMFVNHYPVLYGLQILKNDEWIGVEPLPHAFVVNFGLPIK
ncbi:hypothetical protein P3L10_015461 [Capsicum annuum]